MKLENLFFKDDNQNNNSLNQNSTIIKSQPTSVSSSEKQWGIFAHLSAFAGYFIPFGNILGPLIIYYMKKDEGPFVSHHAKAALNFQLSFAIYSLVFILIYVFAIFAIFTTLPFMMFGLILGPIILYALIQLIFILKGVSAASDGRYYKYRFTIRFIK